MHNLHNFRQELLARDLELCALKQEHTTQTPQVSVGRLLQLTADLHTPKASTAAGFSRPQLVNNSLSRVGQCVAAIPHLFASTGALGCAYLLAAARPVIPARLSPSLQGTFCQNKTTDLRHRLRLAWGCADSCTTLPSVVPQPCCESLTSAPENFISFDGSSSIKTIKFDSRASGRTSLFTNNDFLVRVEHATRLRNEIHEP